MSKVIPVLVSASGISPTEIEASKGDTIDFQPSGPNPPTSVSVTEDLSDSHQDASALFGTSACPVPSKQQIRADDGAFKITARRHTAVVLVVPPRDVMPNKPIRNP